MIMNSVRAPSRIRASLLSCIASAYIGTEGGCERPRNHPVGTTYISAPNQSGWGWEFVVASDSSGELCGEETQGSGSNVRLLLEDLC